MFTIKEFAATAARFAEVFLAEAEVITEYRVKHGQVQKFPSLTRETAQVVVVLTMELQMVEPRAQDEDEFCRNLKLLGMVRLAYPSGSAHSAMW